MFVFQEPSLLSSLQDNGLTDVMLHALLIKDVSAAPCPIAACWVPQTPILPPNSHFCPPFPCFDPARPRFPTPFLPLDPISPPRSLFSPLDPHFPLWTPIIPPWTPICYP